MHTRKLIAIAALGLFGGISAVSAHTTSLGYVPGAVAGTVTFWAGTYASGHSAIAAEGTGTLDGVTDLTYTSGPIAFMGVVSSKPAGLMDGTNNFYWASGGGTYGSTTEPSPSNPVVYWESITITGLTAGTYNFVIADDARTTATWRTYDPGGVQITLTAGDVSGVPEPLSLALAGLGLVGVALSRRGKKAA